LPTTSARKKQQAPIYPQTKVSQDDWLALARETLIRQGVEHVRILSLAQKLKVSRSSFYWYFKNKDDLFDKLILYWKGKNTKAIVDQSSKPSKDICQGILNLFECWTNDDLFDPRLDFAIREWSRRSATVKSFVHRSDDERVDAITQMFRAHGHEETDAFVRARIVYFMQIGYYTTEIIEPLEKRLSYLEAYVHGFTGQQPREADLERFRQMARRNGFRSRMNRAASSR
jgi:AcrR family transcriptional regulator